MPLLLRKIDKKTVWNREEKPSWLDNEQVPANTLCDLQTKENCLSVWVVEENLSNLEDIVTAISCTRDFLTKVDYALFDMKYCLSLGIDIEESEGNTPDMCSNKWHRNLIELSVSKIAELAKVMYRHAKIDRVKESRVRNLIKRALGTKGRIDSERLSKYMKNSLGSEELQKCSECGQVV